MLLQGVSVGLTMTPATVVFVCVCARVRRRSVAAHLPWPKLVNLLFPLVVTR